MQLTTKKTVLEYMFDFSFVLYVISVFCFNDNAEYLVFIYLSLGLCLASALLTICFNSSKIVVPKILIVPVMYAVYCYLSSLWAWEPAAAVQQSSTVFQLVVSMIIFVVYFSYRGNYDLIIKSIAIAGIIASIYVIIDYGGLSEYYNAASEEGARLGSVVGQLNSIGMNVAYSVLALFYYAFYYKKYVLYPCMFVPFLVSMGTGSRKALLIIIIGIFFLLFLSQMIKKEKNILKVIGKYFLIAVCCILVFCIVINLPFMATVNERMYGLFETLTGEQGDSSSMIRMEMIKAGFEQFVETPVFGIGLANASIVNEAATGKYTYLHNDFIEQLVNLGIVGFSLFYGVLLYALVWLLKLLKTKQPPVLLSLIILVVFLINTYGSVTYYSKTTYIFITLWLSVVYTLKKRVAK